MQIYVKKNGQQLGPYTVEQLQQLLEMGGLAAEDLAWHGSLPDWVTVGALLENHGHKLDITSGQIDKEIKLEPYCSELGEAPKGCPTNPSVNMLQIKIYEYVLDISAAGVYFDEGELVKLLEKIKNEGSGIGRIFGKNNKYKDAILEAIETKAGKLAERTQVYNEYRQLTHQMSLQGKYSDQYAILKQQADVKQLEYIKLSAELVGVEGVTPSLNFPAASLPMEEIQAGPAEVPKVAAPAPAEPATPTVPAAPAAMCEQEEACVPEEMTARKELEAHKVTLEKVRKERSQIEEGPLIFSAMCPRDIVGGSEFVMDVWAYTEKQKEWFKELAKELGRERFAGTKRGIELAQGTMLQIIIDIPSLEVRDGVDTFAWVGEPTNASFVVSVPDKCRLGQHAGTAYIRSEGLLIAKLQFSINVAMEEVKEPKGLGEFNRIESAFACYAHEDRDAVLGRIQGMQHGNPDLQVFVDVISLRSGDNYREEIQKQIPEKDVFYLFWSKPASESTEVEREWKWALESKGLSFIDPVPLVSPQEVPPPTELNTKHFNDVYLAYISAGKDDT